VKNFKLFRFLVGDSFSISKFFIGQIEGRMERSSALAPTLKPSIASGKLKETSNLPPSNNEEKWKLLTSGEFIKEDGSGKFHGDSEDDFQIPSTPMKNPCFVLKRFYFYSIENLY
jgi:hypothetical protein